MSEPNNSRLIRFETLDAYMQHLERSWRFSRKKYPGMPDPVADESGAAMFTTAHILLHMVKSTGGIAAQIEKFDHTETPADSAELRELTRKQFANALRLAALLGMKPEDLLRAEVS